MKDHIGAILREDQERYLVKLQPPRDALETEMEAYAAEHDVPISDPEVARLLRVLVVASRARAILEVGTAIGYGALVMARAAPEARVVTIDRDRDMLDKARRYLERGEVLDRVDLLHGPALEVLADLQGPFDFVYVDAEKTDYRRYLDLIVPALAVGGMVTFDNVLWKGKVADLDEEDETTRAIRAFNPYLMIHPQLQAQILPIGDGFAVASKTRPVIREMGGPF